MTVPSKTASLRFAFSTGVAPEEGRTPQSKESSEKIKGRIAMLTALLLVELATGKGVINYYTPAIILIQVYFVAAVGAVRIQYEKDSVGVWPKP